MEQEFNNLGNLGINLGVTWSVFGNAGECCSMNNLYFVWQSHWHIFVWHILHILARLCWWFRMCDTKNLQISINFLAFHFMISTLMLRSIHALRQSSPSGFKESRNFSAVGPTLPVLPQQSHDMTVLSCFVGFAITSNCLGYSCGIEIIAVARSRAVTRGNGALNQGLPKTWYRHAT